MVWLRKDAATVPRAAQVWEQVSMRRCWGVSDALAAALPAIAVVVPWVEDGYRVRSVDRRGSGSASVWLEGVKPAAGGVVPEATVSLEWCL